MNNINKNKEKCYPVLCNNSKQITSRKDFKKWSMVNHPDKVPPEKKDEANKTFQKVSECVDLFLDTSDKKFECDNAQKEEILNRKNKKKSSCVRKIENWTYIQRYHRFDKNKFQPDKVLEELIHISPKMVQLIKNIKELDRNDLKNDNKLYKHFIFSDVKEGGYGSKIIASALSAMGFNNCFEPNKNGYTIKKPDNHPNKHTYGMLSSTAIYNKPTNLKTVKNIVNMYNKRPDNIYGNDMRFIILDSGFKEGIDLFDVKYAHIFETPKNTADLTQAVGRATRSCGQKGLEFIKNKGWELFVYLYASTHDGEENNLLFNQYLKYEGVELGKVLFRENLEKLAIKTAVDRELNHQINKYKNVVKKSEKKLLQLQNAHPKHSIKKGGKHKPKTPPCSQYTGEHIIYKRNGKSFCRKKTVKKKKNISKQLAVLNFKEQLTPKNKKELQKYITLHNVKNDTEDIDNMSFKDYQKYINKIYKKYKYEPIIVENLCDKHGKMNRVVDFTESQQFVSQFLRPTSPHKGLLVWHSVGTGKTCTALATKSLLFEKDDYTILWVTRTTLKEDIWKNMFVWVCDHHIRERLELGENIPENPTSYKKYLLSKFLQPVSYRQFSNAMSRKGKLYEQLVSLNGKEDYLKKTFVIIDEAHKLYSKDLVGMEKPNTKEIEKSIFNSYKLSGKDSCKVMLMTATPIADEPMEFIKLVNLLIGDKEKRFTTDYNQFIQKYVQGDWNFNENGKEYFQNTLKGLISYLNRSYDPRQFVQPTFHKIMVPISEYNIDNQDNLENCNLLAQTTYENFLKENNIFGINFEEALSDCLEKANQPLDEIENIEELTKKELSAFKKELKKQEKICNKMYKNGKKIIKKGITEKNRAEKKCLTRNKKIKKKQAKHASKLYQKNALDKCNVKLY